MGQRLALIVGNSLYADTTLAGLQTPDVDVGALGEILLDSELGGFDDVNVLVNMSSHIIRRSIASFYAKRSKADLLLLYFSGHGILDDQGLLYLAVRDTDSKLLRGTAISANYITDEMNNSRSQRQVLILDCCHSGAFARGSKGKPGNSVGTAAAFEGSGYGRVVLTASDATQYAWEGDQIIGDAENSLFTHYILEGIKSGAADTNGDGQITIDELYDYVYEHVVRQTPRQTPGKWSYKEQGEIIIAQVLQSAADSSSIAKLRDFDPNLDERLKQLYNEGLGAYWLEEWDKAIRCFQAILEVRPDYPDAAKKFELCKQQQRFRGLYQKVLEAEQDEDWLLAVSRLEELLLLAPDYEDARQRLELAKQNHLLSTLYNEARQLTRAENYQAVLKILTQINHLEPNFPDPDGLLSFAKKNVAEQEHQKKLENTYHQALREMDAGDWESAEKLLNELINESPDYPNASRLLERVQSERVKNEAAQKRSEQITMYSQQAVGLARAKQWQQVLEKIKEIKAIDPQNTDCDQLAIQAQAEVEHQNQETARETQLAGMYTTAVKMLEEGDYQKALQLWGEIRRLEPKYPDRKKVYKTAKRKLATISKPKTRLHISRRTAFRVGGFVLVLIIVAGAWYGWYRSRIIFFDDFNHPDYTNTYDQTLWTVGYDFTNSGKLRQTSEGVGKLTVLTGRNNLGEYGSVAYAKPRIPLQSEPLTCETRLALWQTERGSAKIQINLFKDGAYHSQIRCEIYQWDDETKQYFHCHSGGHQASGEYSEYINSKVLEISPGTWHEVSIHFNPKQNSFKVWLDDEVFYSSPIIEQLGDSEFLCQPQVENYNNNFRTIIGHYDYFKISKGLPNQ